MKFAQRLATMAEIVRHPGNAGRQGAALLDYLRWNFGHRAMGVDSIVPLVGEARLILSGRQNYATLVYACGLWDFREQASLLHLLRPGDTFVDVGANVGGYTVLASAVAGAYSIAFEPVPETYGELLRNLRLNDIEPLVQARCCALGDVVGPAGMTLGRGGLNHVVSDGAAPGAITVEATRLDAALAGVACRLIKLDAEGFELHILRGAPETLADAGLQAAIIELNGSGGRYGTNDGDVHQEISRFGFSPCTYDPRTRVLTPVGGYNRDGLNTLYVRDQAVVAARLAEAEGFTLRGQRF